MSTSRPILPFNGLPTGSCRRYQASGHSPNHLLLLPKGKINRSCLGNGLQFLNSAMTELIVSKTKMDMVVSGSVQPGTPLPSDPSPGPWKLWIVGVIATVILPFLGNKWGPLLKLKKQVETALNTVEGVAEVIEQAAEKVDKVAEEVADHLPAGGKLKEVAEFIENTAEAAAKGAHLVDETIEKVEELEDKVEDKLEPFIEPLTEEAKQTPKEANDQS